MRLKLILVLGLLIHVTTLLAQQKLQVSGVVTEKSTSLPAIGVNVTVKGTTEGTVTNIDGEYTLKNVAPGATLQFTFVGMNSVEERVNGRTRIHVALTEDSKALEEVVVIGYGTTKAKDLTAPIAVVKSEDLVKHPTSSVMGALQGKVAGVKIVSNGAPGAAPSVQIRGVGSLTKSEPLYVVDGMFYSNIDFLNSTDIQDMSILKDASAASIYGVRAANGVVIITTKKGTRNSKATVTYDGYIGFQQATNKLQMANSAQYAQMQLEKNSPTDKAILMNSINLWGGDANAVMPAVSTDWYKELLRTAMIQNHSLDISGGTDKTTYSVGLSYFKQDGIMNVENYFDRLNLRTNADYMPYEWLKLGTSMVVSHVNKVDGANAAWESAYVAPPIMPVYDENRSAADAFPMKFASPSQIGLAGYFSNPMAKAYYSDKLYEGVQILPVFYAEISFLKDKNLKFKSMFSQDISFAQNRTFVEAYKVGGGQENKVSNLEKVNDFNRNWVLDHTLTYQKAFGQHALTVMVGQSLRSENSRNLKGTATGVNGLYDEYKYLNKGSSTGRTVDDNGTSYRGESYFGRVSYDFAGKYYVSATMRADGTTKYQEKWGYFPSVGVAWNLSNEAFMKKQQVFDFLKLRASWGRLGNNNVQANDGFASITQNMGTSGIFGSSAIPGYTNLSFFNYLKWEVVDEYNFGVDAKLLQNRLGAEVDYYHRTTEDLAFSAPLPMGLGSLLGNYGKVLNSGVEVSLNWQDKIGRDFAYYVGANLTTIHNEVKSLNGLPYIYGGSAEFRTITKVGEAFNSYYGLQMVGVYQNQAEVDADPIAKANGLKPGDFKYRDVNGDKAIDDKDRVILGSYIPNFTYGLNLGFSYKQFELSVAMQGQSGSKIVNRKRGNRRWQGDINYDADMVENRWTGEGSTNSYPSALGTINPWNMSKFSSFFVEDGSYFRIQNIQAAYTFPARKLGTFLMPSMRLSLTAERPYTSFKSNGFTPEVGGIGFDNQVYPLAATYTLGLRMSY